MAHGAEKRGEIERLSQLLADARQQLAAASEVLTALGQSGSGIDEVLGTVVESARRLCRADVAQIHLLDGGTYRLARSAGHVSEDFVDYLAHNPVVVDRRTVLGRVGLDRRTHQIDDVLADPEFGRSDAQRLGGYRSVLGAPMLLDGEVVGVLTVWRNAVDPFDRRAAELLTTFSAEAAIAIRSVNLLRALEARTAEVARKVEQLEALEEVGQAVSSSLDLDEVLSTIVTDAVRLSRTDGGSILEFEENNEDFRLRTAYGTSAEILDALRRTRVRLHDTLVGLVAREGRPRQIPDLLDAPLDPHLQCLSDAGWRSVLAVPMLREGRIVGALVVQRRAPGGFSAETCDLLTTFASQSALAIVNARLFRELERKSAELEVASRHKSEFLASMSHELRTPLNAVIGFSEVLLERMFGDINERQEEYLRDIWSSGKHLLELLNDILDLSKVEAGQMHLRRRPFSGRQALEYGLSLVRERAARHAIALELEAAPDVGLVDADELRFKQVVLNLLSNALKFTPDGGRVTVRGRAHGSELVVTVTDTGIGIPPEDHERIFESFQQGSWPAPSAEGTGLGLTLSKRIVELHGGRIWLDSEVGAGSTFGFAIPTGVAERPDTVRPAAPEAPGGARPTVVLGEDDRWSLDLLTLYFESAGFEVVTAHDGEEALELVRRLLPACVVFDVRLPELDGWDLLAMLKADPLTALIPIIVMSTLDERGKGFALGAADYLVKPLGHDEVRTALARITSGPDGGVVLAIDDDPATIELIKAVLEPEGWAVLGVTAAEEGLAITRSCRPAAVVLDLLMPETDGFAVFDALRSESSTRAVPIVVLTSKAMTRADKERLNGQVSDVARQADFDAAALVDLVRRAIGTPGNPGPRRHD